MKSSSLNDENQSWLNNGKKRNSEKKNKNPTIPAEKSFCNLFSSSNISFQLVFIQRVPPLTCIHGSQKKKEKEKRKKKNKIK